MEEALSLKVISMGDLDHLSRTKQPLAKEIHTLESKFVQLGISESGWLSDSFEAKSMFIEEIKAKKFEYGYLD